MLVSGSTCPICSSLVDPLATQCPECQCVVQIGLESPSPGDGSAVRPMVQAAIDRSREQIGSNLRHGLAHYTLGLGYLNYGLMDQGLEELSQAAALLPEQHPIRWEIAVVSAQRGMNEAALHQLGHALRLAPTNRDYRYFEAMLNSQLAEGRDELRTAVQSWLKAYDLAPELAPARDWLQAFVQEHAHKLQNANKAIVAHLSPADLDAAWVLATTPESQAPPLPAAPKALQDPGKIGINLLRKIAPGRAAAIEEMHTERVAAHQQTSVEHEAALRDAQEARTTSINRWKERATTIRNDLPLMARLCLAVAEVEEEQRRAEEQKREEQARRMAEAQEALRQLRVRGTERTAQQTHGAEAAITTPAKVAPIPVARKTTRGKRYHSTGARYLQGFPTGKANDKGTLTITNWNITFKHPGLLGGWEFAIPLDQVLQVTSEKIKHLLSSETRLRFTYRNDRGMTVDAVLDDLNVEKCIKQILAVNYI